MAVPVLIILLNHLKIDDITNLIVESDNRAATINNPKAGEVYVVQVNHGKG